jgi:hypothetical protein
LPALVRSLSRFVVAAISPSPNLSAICRITSVASMPVDYPRCPVPRFSAPSIQVREIAVQEGQPKK